MNLHPKEHKFHKAKLSIPYYYKTLLKFDKKPKRISKSLLGPIFHELRKQLLLDVLDLFPDLFQQFLQPHDPLGHFGVGGFGADGVSFPVHFLD